MSRGGWAIWRKLGKIRRKHSLTQGNCHQNTQIKAGFKMYASALNTLFITQQCYIWHYHGRRRVVCVLLSLLSIYLTKYLSFLFIKRHFLSASGCGSFFHLSFQRTIRSSLCLNFSSHSSLQRQTSLSKTIPFSVHCYMLVLCIHVVHYLTTDSANTLSDLCSGSTWCFRNPRWVLLYLTSHQSHRTDYLHV